MADEIGHTGIRLDAMRIDHTGERIFRLTISEHVFANTVATLDRIDAAVVADCDGDDRSIADTLLALELIVRRAEQRAASKAGGT